VIGDLTIRGTTKKLSLMWKAQLLRQGSLGQHPQRRDRDHQNQSPGLRREVERYPGQRRVVVGDDVSIIIERRTG